MPSRPRIVGHAIYKGGQQIKFTKTTAKRPAAATRDDVPINDASMGAIVPAGKMGTPFAEFEEEG